MMIFLELVGVILVIIFLFFMLNFFLKAFMKTIIVIIAIFVMTLVFSLFLTYNDLKSLNYENTVVFLSSLNDDEELIFGFYFDDGNLIKINSNEIVDRSLEDGIKSNKYLKSFLDDKTTVVVISDNALLRFDKNLEDDLNNIIKEDNVNEFYKIFKEYISDSNFFEITFVYFKNELKKEPRFFFTRFKIVEKTLLWFTGLFN